MNPDVTYVAGAFEAGTSGFVSSPQIAKTWPTKSSTGGGGKNGG